MVVEEVVELLPNGVHDNALVAQLAVFHIAQDVELHIEEFLELEAQLCMTQGFRR